MNNRQRRQWLEDRLADMEGIDPEEVPNIMAYVDAYLAMTRLPVEEAATETAAAECAMIHDDH